MAQKNFTYLLGAGASAQCLPVVSQIPSRIKRFIDYLATVNPAFLIEIAHEKADFDAF